jgi:hypothetical protein
VLKCHLVGRFNTSCSSLHVERYFFVAEWRFFADRVASSWHFLAPPAPGRKVRFVSIWRHQRPDEKSNASNRRYFFVAEWRFFACAAASNAPAYGQNHRTVYEQKWQFVKLLIT